MFYSFLVAWIIFLKKFSLKYLRENFGKCLGNAALNKNARQALIKTLDKNFLKKENYKMSLYFYKTLQRGGNP